MNRKLKLATLVVLIVSVFMIVWVNSGNHSEVGYQGCGDGFVPTSNYPGSPDIYNGPCLGLPTLGTVSGRYGSGATLIANSAFGVFAAASVVAFVFEFRDKKPEPKHKGKSTKKPKVS